MSDHMMRKATPRFTLRGVVGDPKQPRRAEGEPFRAWLDRCAEYARECGERSIANMTESERRSVDAAPSCDVCGAPVVLTPAGRLDVTHDWRAHKNATASPALTRGEATQRDAHRDARRETYRDARTMERESGCDEGLLFDDER